MVAHACNSNTLEDEGGGSTVQGQPSVQNETHLKKNPNKQKKCTKMLIATLFITAKNVETTQMSIN
jgi:hypothetical protein